MIVFCFLPHTCRQPPEEGQRCKGRLDVPQMKGWSHWRVGGVHLSASADVWTELIVSSLLIKLVIDHKLLNCNINRQMNIIAAMLNKMYQPGVWTTACMFFSWSCRIRSVLALLSCSRDRTLCTYWLLRNFRSEVSWSSFLMYVFSSVNGKMVIITIPFRSKLFATGFEALNWMHTPADPILLLSQFQQSKVQFIVFSD